MENVKRLDKGLYPHPQPRGFISLKQYMIVEKDKKKCLMLRFFNETSLTVREMQFKLVQLDFSGRVIDSSPVKVRDMNAAPGKTCALKTGIVLSDKCTDFTVTVEWAFSGAYKYVLRNGELLPIYDVRREPTRKSPRQSQKSSVSKIASKGHVAATLVSLGVIALGILLLVYLSTRSFGNFTAQDIKNILL